MNEGISNQPILDVSHLSVSFRQGDNIVDAVRDVSFQIRPGETLALVGESGSGKSVTALSVLQLLPRSAEYLTGTITVSGTEMIKATESVRRAVRGSDVGIIFQEPMTSLNPLHSIEKQVGETLFVHKGIRGEERRARVLELLDLVGLPDAASRLSALPHELSGGQRQRVMIAMALALEPSLLIADEPTTALDVTIQAQILSLLEDLQKKMGMAILFITHDLNIVRRIADTVCVMKDGEIVERGAVTEIFETARHAYTRQLLASQARPKEAEPAESDETLISAINLRVWYPIRTGLLRRVSSYVKAVDGIDLTIRKGKTLGVVGESGSGKTTLGLALLRLIDSTGEVRFLDQRIDGLSRGAMRPLRRQMQVIFQDPFGSLSPRLSIGQIVGEGLEVHDLEKCREELGARVAEVLSDVGLDPGAMHRYPHEFSGGQRQRISIARALVLRPTFVVLDEPTSALDVSVQAQMIELLLSLQEKYDLTYLFISHDLRVVRALSDDILVMKDGQLVETGSAARVFDHPEHAYTQALLSASVDLRTRSL